MRSHEMSVVARLYEIHEKRGQRFRQAMSQLFALLEYDTLQWKAARSQCVSASSCVLASLSCEGDGLIVGRRSNRATKLEHED